MAKPLLPVDVAIPRRTPEGDEVRHVLADPPKALQVGTTTFPVFRRIGHKRQSQVNLIGWVITPYPRSRQWRKLLFEHQWHLVPGRLEPRVARYDPAVRRLVVLADELYKLKSPYDTWRPKDGDPLNLLRQNLRPAAKRLSKSEKAKLARFPGGQSTATDG